LVCCGSSDMQAAKHASAAKSAHRSLAIVCIACGFADSFY